MKNVLFVLPLIIFAGSASAEDVELTSGRVLRDAAFVRVEAKGVRIKHKGGEQVVTFSEVDHDTALSLGAYDHHKPRNRSCPGEVLFATNVRRTLEMVDKLATAEFTNKAMRTRRSEMALKEVDRQIESVRQGLKTLDGSLKRHAREETNPNDTLRAIEVGNAMLFSLHLSRAKADAVRRGK